MTELGSTLRRWRDRVSPAEVGLPSHNPRRAAGLRREELAMLAGISVDYVTRLEQSRAKSPSAQVLTALARALRLSDDECEHLFRLADLQPPSPGHISAHVTPGLQRLLDQLTGAPICVNDAAWTVITWNSLWAALIGEPPAPRGHSRNIIWNHFTGQLSRVRYVGDQEARFEATMVGDLRAATARYPADTYLASLVADLCEISRFAELWNTHAVGYHDMGSKTIVHPVVGSVDLDCDVLTVHGSDLRVVAYTAAPGSESAEKLQLLSVIGTQTMADH